MQGVGPGSVLGGRYAVTLRTSEGPHHERWRATDHTLDRDVVLVCFPAGSSVAAAALDAARRAAGIEDSRLTRVLDVGTDRGIGFIVEEPMTGAVPLLLLLKSGGLVPDEVRRVTGEAATALDKASHRGLHHLALTPSSLLRMPDGGVKIRGLATEAALTETDRLSEQRALRADAVGLVKIAYAGLTGRWPMVSVDDGLIPVGSPVGLEAAPTIVGGVAAPSEIAVGVPNDLDLICRMTLSSGRRGPVSPGDLALQIAPWPLAQSSSDGATGMGLRARDDTESIQPTRVLPAEDTGPRASPGTGSGSSRNGAAGAAGPAAAAGAAAAGAAGATRAGTGSGGGAGSAGGAAASAASGAGGGGGGDTGAPSTMFFDRVSEERSGEPVPSREAPTERLQGGIATAGAAAAGVAGAIGGKMGSFARAAADKAAARTAERRSSHEDEFHAEDLGLIDAMDESPPTRLEPPVPVFGRDTPEAPSGAQSRIALAIVGVLVLVALFIGVSNVMKIGQHDGQPAALTVTKTRAPSAGQAPSETPQPSPTDSEAPPPASVVTIVGGTGFDPTDGTEADQNVKLTYDGDPSTKWRSRWYATPAYNGDKKGVGILLDLSEPIAVKEVELVLDAEQNVTVYATDASSTTSTDGAQRIGSAKNANGTVTIKADGDLQPASKILVLVTKAGRAETDGRYRAQVSEVTVR